MSFVVINSVRASKEALPGIILTVQRLGLDALRGQPGFKLARLMVSENETEAMLLLEWENREAFMAYRQSDLGRRVIESAAQLHPQISFYEVLDATLD